MKHIKLAICALMLGLIVFSGVKVFSQCFNTSPDGSTIPPLSQIIDSTGGVWTVTSALKINKNGSPAGATANVALLLWFGGNMYHENLSNNWYEWNGSTWGTGPLPGGDPRGTAPPPPPPPDQLTSTLGYARTQQPLNHQAVPLGVPQGYSWQAHGNVQAGSNPPSGYSAMTAWGQVFQVSGSASIPLTLSLRHYKTYVLTTSNQLIQVQNQGTIAGAQFLPDYSGNSNTSANIVNSNGVMTVTVLPDKAFQFWPSGRVSISPYINPNTIKAWVVAVEAKVSLPSGTTDPGINTNYLLSVGADYWQTTSAPYPNNAGIGQGRMTYLTTDWTCKVFSNVTDSSLDNVQFNC